MNYHQEHHKSSHRPSTNHAFALSEPGNKILSYIYISMPLVLLGESNVLNDPFPAKITIDNSIFQ